MKADIIVKKINFKKNPLFLLAIQVPIQGQ